MIIISSSSVQVIKPSNYSLQILYCILALEIVSTHFENTSFRDLWSGEWWGGEAYQKQYFVGLAGGVHTVREFN